MEFIYIVYCINYFILVQGGLKAQRRKQKLKKSNARS